MKLFLTLSLFMLQLFAGAQLTTVLNVNKPSATLSEWYRNNSTITYVVSKTDSLPQQVMIRATLKTSDGSIVATKDILHAQSFTLVRGTRVFFAKDILPMELMVFTGEYRSTLARTGKLPAGVYILEVQLVKPPDFLPVSPVQVRTFNLAATQLPVLMLPAHNDSLDLVIASTAITFRWTPLTGGGSSPAFYRLQVFPILPFQNPLQAMRANFPLLDVELRGITQYIWRPQLNFRSDSLSRKFIWTIQTLNSNHMPVDSDNNIEARSEPFVFRVSKKN